MTPTDSDALAKRIINTWHGGPPLTEWRDTLDRLDAGKAGTAFARLRADLEHAPTIARFLREYKNLHTANDDAPCPTCQGDSWVELERDDYRFRHGVNCQGGDACRCQGTAVPCETCNRNHRHSDTPKRITER